MTSTMYRRRRRNSPKSDATNCSGSKEKANSAIWSALTWRQFLRGRHGRRVHDSLDGSPHAHNTRSSSSGPITAGAWYVDGGEELYDEKADPTNFTIWRRTLKRAPGRVRAGRKRGAETRALRLRFRFRTLRVPSETRRRADRAETLTLAVDGLLDFGILEGVDLPVPVFLSQDDQASRFLALYRNACSPDIESLDHG